MAQLILDIPDAQIPRIVEAVKTVLHEGDAVDLENPTNQEVIAKLKEYTTQYIVNFVKNRERQALANDYVYEDLGIS